MDKVLIVTRVLPHWRIELFEKISVDLKSSGIHPVFTYDLTSTVDGNHKSSGYIGSINYHEGRIRKFFKFEYLSNTVKAVIKYRPQIVVVESSPNFFNSWLLIVLSWWFSFKLVGWSSGYTSKGSRVREFLKKIFYKSFDAFVVYHAEARVTLSKYLSGSDNVYVIGNSPGSDRIKKAIFEVGDKPERYIAESQNYSEYNYKLLFVGKMTKPKKLDTLLRAVKLLNKKQYVLILVGDGPERAALQKQKEFDGLSNVFFTGTVLDGVDAYFQFCDVFILPGTGGMALIQAAFNGMSLVSSYADGIGPEIVKDGVNGVYLDEFDHISLAQAIEAATSSRGFVESCGKSSLEISELFTTEKVARRMKESIEVLL